MTGNSNLISKKVGQIYDWLDSAICNHIAESLCRQCGKCCDFEAYDHLLFVTSPEIIYLTENLGKENVKPMTTGRCLYNINNKCTIHKFRFAGCRIFNCKADQDFQSRLSESAAIRFKEICADLNVPYRYTDLATALNS